MASVVAVAGGTGGLGQTIVEQILCETAFKVLVLTRRDPSQVSQLNKAEYVQVEYDDIPSLSSQLERLDISTVICTIGMYGEDRSVAQCNLIQAADQASTVQRFIPSEFGYLTSEDNKGVDPGVQWHVTAANLLRDSNLTYTRVVCGAFMDFLGIPHVRTKLAPLLIAIDVENCEAAIPGDGNDVFNLAYSYDVASMVAKLLSVDQWDEFSVCAVDDMSFNDILRIAEEVRGRKFRVRYSSPEDVLQGKMEVLPHPEGNSMPEDDFRAFNIFVATLIVSAKTRITVSSTRVWATFPGFHPKTVREFLIDAWDGRE